MEPRIHFCTSADGTRIAYATSGEGQPLVFVSGFMGNMEREMSHVAGISYGEVSRDQGAASPRP